VKVGVGVKGGVYVNPGVLFAMATRVAVAVLARTVWATEVEVRASATRVSSRRVGSWLGSLKTGTPCRLQATTRTGMNEAIMESFFCLGIWNSFL
jgi:hypothetical protein